ncbi:MAG: hypothetical protein PUD93_00850 [Lachnospiraceae bacterium]|nr:hypothetical protein [Lachnospiraceae bacterium]
MDFSDKLNFLMNITQTSNKELAEGISVDRSLISLLRTGKRGMPRNREHISHMAHFFAKRCTADFQCYALSEMLGNPILRSSMPTNVLADYLNKWLTGDPDVVDHILEGIQYTTKTTESENAVHEKADVPVISGETSFHYGSAGKRDAMRQMMHIIRTLEEPCTILLASDDNLEWLFEDYSFTQELQSGIIEVLQKGFTLCQIMPSVNFLNRYVESLRYWLPIYATGQTEVYYYPRLRDNLYCHATFIVPGQCVHYSTSVGFSTNHITLMSTEPNLVREYTMQYQDYLALCHPALIVHDTPPEFVPCFQNMFSQTGATIQKVFSLSGNTLPEDYLLQLVGEIGHSEWKCTYQMYLDEYPHFIEKLKTTPFIDIGELATADDVRSGKIPIASPFKLYEKHPVYTPKTYILHLQNILYLMDEYDNYHFIPSPAGTRRDYSLFVNDDGLALLIRNAPPAFMLEIRRPEMVQACKEHLMRMVENIGQDGIMRMKTRIQIKALIRELQNG